MIWRPHRHFTFGPFLLLLHCLAIFLQLLVCKFVERVGTLCADDNLGLILLFNDGLGCCHKLPLQDTQRNAEMVEKFMEAAHEKRLIQK